MPFKHVVSSALSLGAGRPGVHKSISPIAIFSTAGLSCGRLYVAYTRLFRFLLLFVVRVLRQASLGGPLSAGPKLGPMFGAPAGYASGVSSSLFSYTASGFRR